MNTAKRTPAILRSLLGQTTLLSLALLLLVLAYFVVLPLFSMDRADPVNRTIWLVRQEAFPDIDQQERPLSEIRNAETVRDAVAANENFRLYVRRGAEELQIGAEPRWVEAARGSREKPGNDGEVRDGRNPASSYIQFGFEEGNAKGRVDYLVDEQRDFYFEVGGLTVPVEQATGLMGGLDPSYFWWSSRRFLVMAGVIFLGVISLFLLLARSIKRVTTVAHSLDPQSPNHALPERGLPSEILPLVRAVNRMIRRIDQSNEEQAFFLAAAAHELRTPLAVVRTRLENLPEGQDKEDLKNDLRSMSRLVDQLLRLMSVRNKGKPSETVDLVSVARNVVSERAPLVIDKGVEIDLEANGQRVEVSGDEHLLKVALSNLVDNALSFSDPGQRLMVQVGPEKNITVRDEGPGIPPKELDNIFRPFAKNPPNRAGHGLGLAITRSIMALHGGSVNAANHKNGGAAFALQF